jgi:hypothetical protein
MGISARGRVIRLVERLNALRSIEAPRVEDGGEGEQLDE